MSSFHEIKPLSNFDIEKMCKKLKIKNVNGVYMRDELKGKMSGNESLILNIDHSKNCGTHWVCLFNKSKFCLYFDSFGFPPPVEVIKYCKTKNINLYCSSFRIQWDNEVICGHYCIYVLHRLSSGYDWYDILDELYRHKK